jgi:C-5 cytosine-specific DNA methylase
MEHSRPLAVDLFAGLFGWGQGLVAEGYQVVGFDLEDMNRQFGISRPDGCYLVLQDVLTLHGSQFKDAALIVASPPCQEFSYMAMPWSKAKEKEDRLKHGPEEDRKRLTALFDACFRIQREASEAAGWHIPLIIENVRGAQKWVGRARWNFGSFYLWGDVPALMPITLKRWQKIPDGDGIRTDKGRPAALANYDAMRAGMKNNGGSWFNIGSPGQKETNRNPVHDAIKQHKSGRHWFSDKDSISGSTSGHSTARKAASAMIAKIPEPLARYIARVFKPRGKE